MNDFPTRVVKLVKTLLLHNVYRNTGRLTFQTIVTNSDDIFYIVQYLRTELCAFEPDMQPIQQQGNHVHKNLYIKECCQATKINIKNTYTYNVSIIFIEIG